MAAVVALVVLRVVIGLHFSVEGINKFVDPKPYTAGFLLVSEGPFAPLFESMVWDKDGLARLDLEQSLGIWDRYRAQAVTHFGLDANQAQAAEAALKQRELQLREHLSSSGADIDEYRKGLARRDACRRDQVRSEVASLRGQLESIERELTAKRRQLLGPIDQIWAGYERDINALAAGQGGGKLALPKAGRQFMDSEMIDVIIRYFDVAVGMLLIFGLFTRAASIAGGVFLLSICASQWPLSPGAQPIWYQFIEAVSMAVLAATGAGCYAGFDNILGLLLHRCCPPRQGTES